MMKKSILTPLSLCLVFFLLWIVLISSTVNSNRIHFLSKKIIELQAIKRGFIAKALRHENQAQRLQFIDGEELEARKHASLALKYHLAAVKVQQVINQLKKEKCILCKEIK